MATFDDVVAIAATWPGVTVDSWYGTPGLKVGGKGFCRMWSQREHDRDDVHDTDVLVVMSEPEEKAVLIDSNDGLVFETPHYHGHGAMLIRLADISTTNGADLAGFLEDGYRIKASKKLLAEFDA